MGGLSRYGDAVRAIKQSTPRSRYGAAKGANSQQLALYHSIGGHVSANTRAAGTIEGLRALLEEGGE